MRAACARFNKNHREYRRLISRAYAHRKRSNTPKRLGLTVAQWNRLIIKFNRCCAYCGRYCEHLTQDHVIPICKGGKHILSNVVPACSQCNCRKNRLDVKEFLKRVLT
jgi:5-methylcytosine-specific restriction endonuclease McrA